MHKHRVIIAAYIFSIFHHVDIYLHRLTLFEDGASLHVRKSTTFCTLKASLSATLIYLILFLCS